MRTLVSLIFCLFGFWASVKAQDTETIILDGKLVTVPKSNNEKSKEDTLAEILDTIVNYPKIEYDIRRSEYNERIDQLQEQIDLIDGYRNRKIIVEFDKGLSPIATQTFIFDVDSLQIMLEKSSLLSHYEKVKFLVRITDVLRKFNTDALDGYFVFIPYQELLSNMQHIYLHIVNGNLLEYTKRHPKSSLENIACFARRPDAFAFLQYHAKTDPNAVLIKNKDYAQEVFFDTLISHIAQIAPTAFPKYLVANNDVGKSLRNSNHSIVKTLIEMFETLGVASKSYALLDDVVKKRISIYDADSIANNKYWLYKNLIRLRTTENPYGSYSIDEKLNEISLDYCREINAMYEMHDAAKRFEGLQKFTPQEVYTMIVYTEDEIFTSTFNGSFKILLQKLKPMNGREMLYSVNDNKMRVFVKLCAGYDVLDQFLNTMDKYAQEELLFQFIQNLEKPNTPLEDIVHVADTYGSIRDVKLSNIFKDHVAREYEEMELNVNKHGMEIYGILNDLFCPKKAPTNSVVKSQNEQQAPKQNNSPKQSDIQKPSATPTTVQSEPNITIDNACIDKFISKYQLQPVSYISYNNLLQKDSTIVEQFFFYDDDDGEASFANFMGTYRAMNYKISDMGKWYFLENTKGKRIIILANKTKVDREGQAEITDYLIQNNLNPNIVVHRGHSFYTPKTIEQIPYNTQVVIMGSCGGYNTLTHILEKSPYAQIVSSKQTGTMSVNDPLLKNINEQLAMGKDVTWENVWASLDKQLKTTGETYQRFLDYVPPHKNLGAIFLMAYNNSAIK